MTKIAYQTIAYPKRRLIRDFTMESITKCPLFSFYIVTLSGRGHFVIGYRIIYESRQIPVYKHDYDCV